MSPRGKLTHIPTNEMTIILESYFSLGAHFHHNMTKIREEPRLHKKKKRHFKVLLLFFLSVAEIGFYKSGLIGPLK